MMVNGSITIAQTFLAGWFGKILLGGFTLLTSVRYGAGLYFWRVTEQLERPSYQVLKTLPQSGKRRGSIELRRYDSYLIAETEVDYLADHEKGDDSNSDVFREATGNGFRTCAGYIFGKNVSRRQGSRKLLNDNDTDKNSEILLEGEKMAMTAPVRTVSARASSIGEKMAMTAPVRIADLGPKYRSSKISFVISNKYTLKTVPKPIDRSVKLRQVPPHTLAVSTFAGPPPTDARIREERQALEEVLEKHNIHWKKGSETLVYGYHDPFLTPNFLRRNEVALVLDGRV